MRESPVEDLLTSVLLDSIGVEDVDTCYQYVIQGANINAKSKEFGATLMHYAALNVTHGLEMIDFLCALGLQVDAKDNFGNTPIHYAVDAENFEIAKDLLELYNDAWNDPICNLLHFFVQENNFELAKSALEHDPQMLFYDNVRGLYAFHIAAESADVKMCKLLLSKGADPRVATNNRWETTALHVAGGNKTHGKELVRFFVSSLNFDVNSKDYAGLLPLHYALQHENLDAAQELLDLGADLIGDRLSVNMENMLHFCVRLDKLKSAKFLHEKNKSFIKEFAEAGLGCLHFAARSAGLEMCTWLLSEGTDCRSVTKNKFEGNALHFVGFNESHGKELARFFVSSLKLDVNARDKIAQTPLHYALKVENLDVAAELLDLGADPTVKRTAFHNENLMHFCVRLNKLKSAKFLHERNESIIKEYTELGLSCLHCAANFADLEMCKWLLSEGVDPRMVTRNSHRDTAFQYAGLNKSHGKELVRFFVSSLKFDVNEKDKLDFTALHYALSDENLGVANELLSLGADLTSKLTCSHMENLMQFCVRGNKINSAKFVHERNKNLIKEVREDGFSCLHLAANYADLEMCLWLVDEYDVDPRAMCTDWKASVVHCTALNIKHGKEIASFFASRFGLDVNKKDK